MCGRFTLIRLAQFTEMFPWITGPGRPAPPRYNIAPSQPIAVVANEAEPKIDFFRWGLLPSWAKDPAVGNRLVNARAETLANKPAFRTALQRRRCPIPADGFFEWKPATQTTTKTTPKTPMYFRRRDLQPFAFAGLWEIWQSPDGGELRTCVIITGEPNDLVRPIHDRMPVIIPSDHYTEWIEPKEIDTGLAVALLGMYPSDEMEVFSVGTAVNRPARDTPDVIEPAIPTAEPMVQGTLFDVGEA